MQNLNAGARYNFALAFEIPFRGIFFISQKEKPRRGIRVGGARRFA